MTKTKTTEEQLSTQQSTTSTATLSLQGSPERSKPEAANPQNGKRPAKADLPPPPVKKAKSTPQTNSNGLSKGQKSLRGFFTSKTPPAPDNSVTESPTKTHTQREPEDEAPSSVSGSVDGVSDQLLVPSPSKTDISVSEADVEAAEASSFATKQSWGKLFAKPVAPKCEHNEPCKTMQTKKAGANRGRSFWMCNRPLGPSGQKERGTQWRCGTFIWSS